MNVRKPIETSTPTSVLSVSFNSDCKHFSIGLESGICIYDTKSCQLKASRDFNAGIGLVQMMGNTNFLGLVGGGKNPKFAMNKAVVWDDVKGRVALEIAALTPVRGIQLSRTHIVVVLQNQVRIYSFAKQPNLLHVFQTADNLFGLCCISDKQVVFPGRTTGQVQVVELATGSLSPDGEVLATASETGTLIRIFSTGNCAKIAELRRGIDPATIYSLGFSPQANAFRRSQQGQPGSPQEGKWGVLSKIPMMPRMFSDVYSFASAPFESGDDGSLGGVPLSHDTVLGTTKPAKGLIGWISEESLIVLGAGTDARWEKFVIGEGDEGKRFCAREGWKRYLRNA